MKTLINYIQPREPRSAKWPPKESKDRLEKKDNNIGYNEQNYNTSGLGANVGTNSFQNRNHSLLVDVYNTPDQGVPNQRV